MHEQTAAVTKGLWYGFLRDKEGYAIRMVGPASKGQVERTLKKLNAETDLETEWVSMDYAMTDFRSDLQDGISAPQFKRLPPDDKRRLVHLMDLYQVGKSKSASTGRVKTAVRVATRFLTADQDKAAPEQVDKYFEQVKKDNPSYDDSQAYATAWSIYCKHKNPGSPSCHQDEYLTGKNASGTVAEKVLSRFEEGKPANPKKNLSPEDAAEWDRQNEENRDNFKTSSNPGGHSNEDVGYVDIRLSKTAGRKPRDTMERHQLKVLTDTLKMPAAMAGVMGGPDQEEAEDILRSKFQYTDAEIRWLKQGKTAAIDYTDPEKPYNHIYVQNPKHPNSCLRCQESKGEHPTLSTLKKDRAVLKQRLQESQTPKAKQEVEVVLKRVEELLRNPKTAGFSSAVPR